MESNHYDVVVVGAGLSGLTAAGVAACQGLRVALVATGPGSFVLGSGYLKTQEILAAGPADELSEAIAFFCEMAQAAGCPFEGQFSSSRHLPTILGDFQSVTFAPRPLWNAEPRNDTSTAIVGIRELSYFDENFMAERLSDQARLLGSSCTYSARQISLARSCGAPTTTLRIAKRFDYDAGFRAELIEALRPAAAGFVRVLVPGMLGLCSREQQIAQFESELGCTVCELPTLPPSIPGLRLFHLLSRHLSKLGVELLQGFPVSKLQIQDGVCMELEVASPGHPMVLRGECAVLATGQHSSTLLGVDCNGHDEQMHPLTSSGSVMAGNLFVAGIALPGSSGSSGDVMEILTGHRAGSFAAATRGHYAAR